MRPEIDYTRQRTVAELLAEHGEAGGGRRSRRRGDGPALAPPPVGPTGQGRPQPGPHAVREPGPPPPHDAGYRVGRPAPVPPRRDRPTETIGDRQRPGGYGGPRGPAPNGADRSTGSTPVREVPGRGAASGPLRAVPPAGAHDGSPPNGRAPARRGGPTVGPGPHDPGPRDPGPRDPGPPTSRAAAAPRTAMPAANPWEPYRGTPAGGPGRPQSGRPAPAPGLERPREPVGRPFLPASPLAVSHRPAASPRGGPPQSPGPRPERVPDPGPATGAYDPFEFDDEDDDGPSTIVGAADGARRAPRRDAFPSLLDGPATALDLGRRSDGPATEMDVTALRRGDGPATDFDVTSFDVTGRPGVRGPGAPADASGLPPAVLRPTFGGARGRPTRAAGLAPGAAAPAVVPAPPPPRVRPFARDIVDGPTELSDSRLDELDGLDDRTDVAAPRRPVAPQAPVRDDPRNPPDEVDDELIADRSAPDVLDDDVDSDDAEHDTDLDDSDQDDDRDDDRAARPAQAWAGVVAQWLAGAVAGAVLWVLFRYLWRELPVVALAAAVLVTAGLVLLVRQLLHNVDRRTTGSAVAVGLLLTASPAVLVLLGR